ncbi:MAG: AAA family ATPase [Candidatus Adiutrix sp.]|jgi:type II secretory pathway predicted ATPase ExeA|nr:AAA family ATPase [Candidatus Adiutrix sp.]
MDYLKHFNLTDRPFKNTYDGRFFYRSAAAGEIFQTLKSGDLPPLVHLKGPDKAGKTSLVRRLTLELKEAGRISLILNPQLTLSEMLRQILIDFGQSHKFSLNTPEEELLGYYHNAVADLLAEGLWVFLAVDHADELPPAMLADLYGLMELEPRWRGRVTLLLCGSSERPWPVVPDILLEVRELTLPPLPAAETEAYVTARLRAAGSELIFSRAALKALAEYGQGRPEVLNQLAERALIAAWSAGRAEVGPVQLKAARASLEAPQNLDYDRLAEAAREQIVRPDRSRRRAAGRLRRLPPVLAAVILAAVILASLGLRHYLAEPEAGPADPPVPAAAPAPPAPPAETAAPAGEDAAAKAAGGLTPSLPSPPAQLLALPQGSLALVVDQDTNTGRLWQGGPRGPGLKAEVAAPIFRNWGLFLFGRPRGREPLIFQYPPARDLPTAEALAVWPRVATLLPQNVLPVIVAPGPALGGSSRPEDLAAIENRVKAWVQSQQYKFPDTMAELYASTFQFFELGKTPRNLSRENFRRALNSEARTSGEVSLTTSQPLIMRDPKNDHCIWAVFNLKYESRLRRDMGLRALVFEKPLLGGQDDWLIAAELWLPEKGLRED